MWRDEVVQRVRERDGLLTCERMIAVLEDFLFSYKDPISPTFKQNKYIQNLESLRVRKTKVFEVDLNDLLNYVNDEVFVKNIIENAHRFVKILNLLVTQLLCSVRSTDSPPVKAKTASHIRCIEEAASFANVQHCVRLLPLADMEPVKLRSLRAADIGSLVIVGGLVTRVSNVKPLLEVAAYVCETCGRCMYQDVSSSIQFAPLNNCPSQSCMRTSVGYLNPRMRTSTFTKYQELRLQELPDEVPAGHIPRSILVQCKGELTRKCAPGKLHRNFLLCCPCLGDTVRIAAILLSSRPDSLKRLLRETYLGAMSIRKGTKIYNEEAERSRINKNVDDIASAPDILTRLSMSIAPEIFGHGDVKKAMLLQLAGGVTRMLSDGSHIRGDLHMCLMGDPGLAKSQLLKFMAVASPRGLYTTGKGSSGVGLTACVVRDSMSSDMVLDAGALVLADGGVCCIDEFDKMDEYDRTAIHEVMEQQTVSIAKAGITTTLNARCSVLAAANPVSGRYNKSCSVLQNMNLPSSLLSRFDLLFLMIDQPQLEADLALARHVTYVHRFLRNPELDFEPLTTQFLRHYVAQARHFNPHLPHGIAGSVIDDFVELRQDSSHDGRTRMTARQLLSVMRLAQGLARLRFDDIISRMDLDEAVRLSRVSKWATIRVLLLAQM